jgi:outer membrane protein OmpA-like peptidoglycan-associated protein
MTHTIARRPAMIRRTLALIAAACAPCAAFADSALHYREGERVDPQQVARILGAAAPMKTRSIRLLDDAPAAAQPQQQQRPAATASLSLPVRFGFDSTDIAASARPQLDALAEGIKLLPAGQAIVIEGHTDAAGPDAYNQALSQRRALMVKRYLVQQHGIDPQRLKDTGYGEQRPIDGADPHAAQNRRVQFRGA